MNTDIYGLAIGLGFAALLGPFLAIADAINQTIKAIEQGKMGVTGGLVAHAENALKHAEVSMQANDSPHTKEGIAHLEAAIDQGKQGNVDEAVMHAEAALQYLEAARK
jgi:hypothetical protein